MRSLKEVWHIALAAIRARVSAENFATYFQPLRFVDGDVDRIELAVDDPFFKDWVQRHYQDLLDDAACKAAGRPLSVEIIVSESPPVVRPEPVRAVPVSVPSPAITASSRPAMPTRPHEDVTRPQGGWPVFPINPHNTFDKFVVGPTNEMSHAACQAVAREPSGAFNPLFIYGGTGLGKTHLLHAIAHAIQERTPSARITYISAEEFTNQFIKSISRQRMDEFRERYRSQCDVLLVDDVHVLAGRERTQEEFFHTFNTLHTAQKQIVLTSDQTPQQINRLEARLRSRFQWGLITDIKAPQLETRVAILSRKAERDGMRLPEDVAFYLAKLISSNVRELEGALTRLSAFASFTRRDLTIEFAEEALREIIESRASALTIDTILKLVAEHFDVKVSDLKGSRRHRVVAHPRSIAMYLCRKHTQSSYPVIGRGFGGKDHSTVISAFRKIEKAVTADTGVRTTVEAIERKLPA